MTITNYGTMGGVKSEGLQVPKVIIDNHGIINLTDLKSHFHNTNVVIRNYAMTITESADVFNNFNGTNPTNNSHLIAHHFVGYVEFENDSSKMILRIGSDFEIGKAYFLDKLIVDTDGTNKLKVDFSHLELGDKDLYTLVKSGEDGFIVNFIGGGEGEGNNIVLHTPITELYKSNIRTMNNFYTISNSMIYPRKRNLVILRERSERRISKNNIDSANPLKSYESFAYQNESQNLQTRRIQRQNKRNYSRNVNNPSLRDSVKQNRGNPKTSQNPHDYYFILTPFINHNLFFQSGRYNLSGFDYGFLTAFSAKVAESNSLGAHFAFSYGSLGDKHDKDLSIRTMNFMLGLNYKLDLVYDMYLKARGDFFYFLNQVKTLTMFKAIKPNNLGFGVSVSYGKDFDFKQGGVLGIEAGIDYKALKSNEISIDSQEYQNALYNLIYADLGLNYAKYFGGFGINLGGGFKANLAPQLAKSILLANSQNRIFVLDNDKYLGYANVALSYVLNARNFDMEFSIAYYGNFGDRAISNGGGFEWRTTW